MLGNVSVYAAGKNLRFFYISPRNFLLPLLGVGGHRIGTMNWCRRVDVSFQSFNIVTDKGALWLKKMVGLSASTVPA
jgi:hypothetical protein